eukprot:1056252-Prymnesium_polylepis.2
MRQLTVEAAGATALVEYGWAGPGQGLGLGLCVRSILERAAFYSFPVPSTSPQHASNAETSTQPSYTYVQRRRLLTIHRFLAPDARGLASCIQPLPHRGEHGAPVPRVVEHAGAHLRVHAGHPLDAPERASDLGEPPQLVKRPRARPRARLSRRYDAGRADCRHTQRPPPHLPRLRPVGGEEVQVGAREARRLPHESERGRALAPTIVELLRSD